MIFSWSFVFLLTLFLYIYVYSFKNYLLHLEEYTYRHVKLTSISNLVITSNKYPELVHKFKKYKGK